MAPWLDLVVVTAVQTVTAIVTAAGVGLIAVFALDRLARGRRRPSRGSGGLPPVHDDGEDRP